MINNQVNNDSVPNIRQMITAWPNQENIMVTCSTSIIIKSVAAGWGSYWGALGEEGVLNITLHWLQLLQQYTAAIVQRANAAHTQVSPLYSNNRAPG